MESPKNNILEFANKAANIVKEALDDSIGSYIDHLVNDEEAITAEFLGGLRMAFKYANIPGVECKPVIMKHHRGVASHEKLTGADILFTTKVNIEGLCYTKGMLIQAKRGIQDKGISKTEYDRMSDQCKKMLGYTKSAFVMDYSKRGVTISKASGIRDEVFPLPRKFSIEPYDLFYDYFRCEIGDHDIQRKVYDGLSIPFVFHLNVSQSR